MAGEPAGGADLAQVATSGTAVPLAAVARKPSPRALSEAAARLADFANRADGGAPNLRLRTLTYPTDPTVLAFLIETDQPTGLVGAPPRQPRPDEPAIQYATGVSLPYLDGIRRAWLRDVQLLKPLMEQEAHAEAVRRLRANEALRLALETEMLEPAALADLHGAPRDYLVKLYHSVHGLIRDIPGFVTRDFLAAERAVRGSSDNAHLKLLILSDDRFTVVPRLAGSVEQAGLAVRQVFAQAKQAIIDFGERLKADLSQVWRYPPIVEAAARPFLTRLGVPGDAKAFASFLGNFAEEESFDPVAPLVALAGVLVLAVTLVVLPGGGLIVVGLEAGNTAAIAWEAARTYRAERDIEQANLANVLGQGRAIAPRKADFFGAALGAWAALLTAVGLLGAFGRLARNVSPPPGPVAGAAGAADLGGVTGGVELAGAETAEVRAAGESVIARHGAESPAIERQARRQARIRPAAARSTRRAVEPRLAVGAGDERAIAVPWAVSGPNWN